MSSEKLSGEVSRMPAAEFHVTFVDAPFVFVSLARGLRGYLRDRRTWRALPAVGAESSSSLLELRPWYRDLPEQLKSLFEKPRPAPAASREIQVRDLWQEYSPNPYSWANSLLVHLLAFTAIVLPLQLGRMLKPVQVPKKAFDLTPLTLNLPMLRGPDKRTGGGGGGGDRSPTPASRGAIPKFSRMPLAPPAAKIPNLQPVMPVQPSLLGPPELKLPEMAQNALWGDAKGVLGPLSNGPGTDGGIGTGSRGGVGPGDGGGYDRGKDAGYGGDIFSVGMGVTAPVATYSPVPAYSEEARKAKYQGVVSLWIVVDAQGRVTDARVAKPLGMGLDEKAVEAIRTWKFLPGKRNGIPVAVRVLVEVSFRLF